MPLRPTLHTLRALTLLFTALAWLGLSTSNAGTLTAVQDNQIQSGANAAVIQGTSGSAATLQLAARDTDYNRKVYVGFDLTGALPASYTFSNATLSLTSSALVGTAGSFTTVSFNVYGITGATAWAESTITWNNAPYNNTGSAIALNASGTVLLGTFTVTLSNVTNVTHAFTGTSGALTTYLNWSAGLLGDYYGTGVTSLNTPSLVLTSTTGPNMNLPGIAFHSSEAATSAYRPVIAFDATAIPIPEPATFALSMSVLALGLAISRRPRALRA